MAILTYYKVHSLRTSITGIIDLEGSFKTSRPELVNFEENQIISRLKARLNRKICPLDMFDDEFQRGFYSIPESKEPILECIISVQREMLAKSYNELDIRQIDFTTDPKGASSRFNNL